MKLSVTHKHLADAAPGNAYFCPIALALKDRGYQDVSVLIDWIRIGQQFYRTTKTMAAYASRFDSGRPCKPHTFIWKDSPR